MKAYQRHLLVCDGKDCKKKGGGKRLIKTAKSRLGKDARYTKASKVKCLGVCKQGPVLVVYPDGVWYKCESEAALEQIVDEHLKGGKVVKKRVLLDMNDG